MMCLSLKIKWDIVLCIYPGDFREDGLDKYKGKAARLRKGLSFGSKIRAERIYQIIIKKEKSNGNMENSRWKKCRGSLLEKYKDRGNLES